MAHLAHAPSLAFADQIARIAPCARISPSLQLRTSQLRAGASVEIELPTRTTRAKAPPRVDDCVVNQTSPLSALQIQALETFCDPALNRDGRHAQRSTAAATCGLARRITAVYDLDRF